MNGALERCPTIIESYQIISDSGFALNLKSGHILGIIFQETPSEADLLLTYPAGNTNKPAEFQTVTALHFRSLQDIAFIGRSLYFVHQFMYKFMMFLLRNCS